MAKTKKTNKDFFWKTLIKALKYDKKNVYWMVVLCFFAIVSSVCGVFVPIYVIDLTNALSVMINRETGAVDLEQWKQIIKYAVIIISFLVGCYFFDGTNNVIQVILGERLGQRFRREINEKMNTLALKYFDRRKTGDTLSIIVNDSQTVAEGFFTAFVTFISAIVFAIGLVIAMFIESWQLSIPVILLIIVAFMLIGFVGAKMNKYFKMKTELLGKLSTVTEESYSGNLIIKSFCQEDKVQEKFEAVNKDLCRTVKISTLFQSLFRPIMQLVAIGGVAVVCVAAALLSKNEPLKYITLVPGFMVFVQQMNYPLMNGAQNLILMQQSVASCQRVFSVLDEESEPAQKKNIPLNPKKEYTIKFDKIKFGYTPEKTIINSLSFTAKPGQKIAIVGPTGAGKTTLVNLLMKFYKPDSGSIYFDDIDYNDIDTNSLRDSFGMVLQDTWTFKGTIKENIKFTNKISDKKLIEACEAANVYHLIKTLPNGFNTILDDSSNLSAGEKQLLTIARAMASDPRMIILDEATSNVDTITEIRIQQAMDKLMKGKTSFVIAHRLSTIKNADLILVVNEGDIVESGNHNALLKKKGLYEKLYNSQFSEEE